MGNLMEEFEDRLMELIEEFMMEGLSIDEIISVLEIRKYSLDEEED